MEYSDQELVNMYLNGQVIHGITDLTKVLTEQPIKINEEICIYTE